MIKTLSCLLLLLSVLAFGGPALAQSTLPVSARMLERGTILSEADLSLVDAPAVGPRPFVINDISRLVGMELRRTLPAGQPFYTNDVKTPDLIKRGEQVTLVVRRGGMTITAAGKAMDDGGRDQTIRVQNVASRRTVEGRVTAPGIVVVQPMNTLAALQMVP
jgi:flagella basal body P-ring formation protein FlgA